MSLILILNVSPGELRGIVATVMMMIIRTRTELAPMITFILWFWIILMMVSEVDGLTPEVSSADILLCYQVGRPKSPHFTIRHYDTHALTPSGVTPDIELGLALERR